MSVSNIVTQQRELGWKSAFVLCLVLFFSCLQAHGIKNKRYGGDVNHSAACFSNENNRQKKESLVEIISLEQIRQMPKMRSGLVVVAESEWSVTSLCR